MADDYLSSYGGGGAYPGSSKSNARDSSGGIQQLGFTPSWDINPNGPGLIATPNSYRVGGGGGGGGGGSGNSTVTQRLRFTQPAPTMPDIPTLELPTPNKRKIRALTQEIAAPSIRKMNEGLQGAMNVKTDNPNVRRMTIREALQGYGSGLENTMSGAGGQARQEHQQELNMAAAQAQANWKAKTEALMTQYQNAYNTYLKSADQITTKEEGSAGPTRELVRDSFGNLQWRWNTPGGRAPN